MNKLLLAVPALAFLAACNRAINRRTAPLPRGRKSPAQARLSFIPSFRLGGGLPEPVRHRQLSVDRFGRRHRADQGGTVDFGASDKPLPADELAKNKPRAVPDRDRRHRAGREHRGVNAGQLKFTGPVLADIYLGKIKNGTIRRSRSSTPASSCPTNIAVVHRSDGSGTTFNFTDYLARSARVEDGPGEGKTVTGPSASAARATRASPATSSRSRTRSAMSSMPTSCRTK